MRHERNLPFIMLLTFIVSVLVASAQSAGTQNIEELRLAAEQGDADAQFGLGGAYVQGTGVPQDLVEAERWFRRAAEQGHAGAQTVLRELYRSIRLLAEQGNADAQFGLGVAYVQGTGVAQDLVEAVRWFRRAAEQGHAGAQARLGMAYFQGTGVPQDFAEAVRLVRLAAQQGNVQGQAALGAAYFTGAGVLQDYVSAHMWLNLATAGGHENSREVRDSVAELMTRAQIAEAQRRAREWNRIAP